MPPKQQKGKKAVATKKKQVCACVFVCVVKGTRFAYSRKPESKCICVVLRARRGNHDITDLNKVCACIPPRSKILAMSGALRGDDRDIDANLGTKTNSGRHTFGLRLLNVALSCFRVSVCWPCVVRGRTCSCLSLQLIEDKTFGLKNKNKSKSVQVPTCLCR